jgi:hypothetical protein
MERRTKLYIQRLEFALAWAVGTEGGVRNEDIDIVRSCERRWGLRRDGRGNWHRPDPTVPMRRAGVCRYCGHGEGTLVSCDGLFHAQCYVERHGTDELMKLPRERLIDVRVSDIGMPLMLQLLHHTSEPRQECREYTNPAPRGA